MVTISDVRDFLNNLSPGRVADNTVQKQIEVATVKINAKKASGLSESTVNTAILVYASYLTYLAYVTEYERTAGVVPGFMVGHLQVLEKLANEFLTYTQQGSPVFTSAVAQPDSLEESLNDS